MRSKGVAVRRSFLSGTILLLTLGIALPSAAQLVNASGKVSVNGNPAQQRLLRKSVTYSSPISTVTAVATDERTAESTGTVDGWPESLTIAVHSSIDPSFKIKLNGGQSNILVGSYCETPGGRNSCDPSVQVLSDGGAPICTVSQSSFSITKLKLGYPKLGGTQTQPFVYNAAGTYSAQCIGEPKAFTGSFNITQTTTLKYDTAPNTTTPAGTPRCGGSGGWATVGSVSACDTEPPAPTSDLPRSGRISIQLTAEAGSFLGHVLPNKTYRWSEDSGPWISYLRDPKTENGPRDYDGSPPAHMEVALEPQGNALALSGVFHISLKQRHYVAEGIQPGAFEFTDISTFPHFEIQLNLSFCTGGVNSVYQVSDYTYDCEWAPGGLPGVQGEPDRVVHVVPHLRTLTVKFTTKCGVEGTYRGTLTVDDDPGFDCGFPPSTGGTGGDGSGGDLGGGTGGGSSGGSGGGGTSTGGSDSNPTGAPRVGIPTSVVNEGVQLNNLSTAKVNLTTSIPAGFNSDVTLAAFSEPDGLAVSVSPSTIAAPGTGNSVLTITTGADTRPQDYRVVLSASGNGLTSYNVVKVTVLCDPPMILGLDQPKSAQVNAGASATLEVKTLGSAPTAYQWYRGQSGATNNPVIGATGRTFTTSTTGDYWVRATNPCGSVDSNTATISPK